MLASKPSVRASETELGKPPGFRSKRDEMRGTFDLFFLYLKGGRKLNQLLPAFKQFTAKADVVKQVERILLEGEFPP